MSRSIPEGMSRSVLEGMSRSVPEGMSRSVPKGMSTSVPKEMSRLVPGGMSRSVPEGMSRSVPKRINPTTFRLRRDLIILRIVPRLWSSGPSSVCNVCRRETICFGIYIVLSDDMRL
ncbi:hypothetical protein Tco_0168779 [Tanacetum coccineum]